MFSGRKIGSPNTSECGNARGPKIDFKDGPEYSGNPQQKNDPEYFEAPTCSLLII